MLRIRSSFQERSSFDGTQQQVAHFFRCDSQWSLVWRVDAPLLSSPCREPWRFPSVRARPRPPASWLWPDSGTRQPQCSRVLHKNTTRFHTNGVVIVHSLWLHTYTHTHTRTCHNVFSGPSHISRFADGGPQDTTPLAFSVTYTGSVDTLSVDHVLHLLEPVGLDVMSDLLHRRGNISDLHLAFTFLVKLVEGILRRCRTNKLVMNGTCTWRVDHARVAGNSWVFCVSISRNISFENITNTHW